MSMVPTPLPQQMVAVQQPQMQAVTYLPAPVEPARNPWIDMMAPAVELANMIANTNFVPAEMKRKPDEIAACILFGAELGVAPMQSLAKIDVVKGRPAPRAELGRALAFAAGHEVWFEEVTNTRVVCHGKRRGSQHVETVTWTMDDAKKAGLAGNPNYAKYPREMLTARASAALVRRMCPEVLGGITMFSEEIGDDIDAPVTTSAAPEAPAPTNTRQRKARRGAAPAEGAPAEPAAPEGPSEQQTKMVMASFAECGITDRDERLKATGGFIGRAVESWSDVTRDEASTVIDGLEKLKAGALHVDVDTDGGWTFRPVDTDAEDPVIDGDELPLDGDS